MTEVLASLLAYAGFGAVFLGSCTLLRPLKFLGIGTRSVATYVVLVGVSLIVTAFLLPAQETPATTRVTLLDEFVPTYQFHEFHSVRVKASKEQTWAAIRKVRADEIFLFRTLTWIRRFGRKSEESILNPSNAPILDVASRTGFLPLADEPGSEIVLGTLVVALPGTRLKAHPTPQDFRDLQQPGFAKAAINFRVREITPGVCEVTTETRVFATDSAAGRKFARYWRVIFPGSALIRVTWLRAIRERAEAAAR